MDIINFLERVDVVVIGPGLSREKVEDGFCIFLECFHKQQTILDGVLGLKLLIF